MVPAASTIELPTAWNERLKTGVLQAIGLAHMGMTHVRSWCVNSRITRVNLQAEVERLRNEVSLLTEELRIKDARMARISPRTRPHYPPVERMAILELKTARGWNLELAARRFLITAATLASWNRRADAEDSTLVATSIPVNRYPDLVTYLAQRLKTLVPSMGTLRIVDILARAGLHLGATTVRRALKKPPAPVPPEPPPPRTKRSKGRTIVAKGPNSIWNVDLTTIETSGTAVPWPPGAVPPVKPFTWWIAVVVDHFSRAVIGFAVFPKQPGTKLLCKTLDLAIRRVGVAPKYTITDQGVQFRRYFRDWCKRRNIYPRFGAIGKHGSIAVTERFILSMKNEWLRKILVPLDAAKLRDGLAQYVRWFNADRPHQALDGATPLEVFRNVKPANRRPRFEPREKYPVRGRCAGRQVPIKGKPGADLRLVVSGLEANDARLLPVVRLKRAA